MTEICFKCKGPTDMPIGILLMYPGRDRTEGPFYTLPRFYCPDCMKEFYRWSNVIREAKE